MHRPSPGAWSYAYDQTRRGAHRSGHVSAGGSILALVPCGAGAVLFLALGRLIVIVPAGLVGDVLAFVAGVSLALCLLASSFRRNVETVVFAWLTVLCVAALPLLFLAWCLSI